MGGGTKMRPFKVCTAIVMLVLTFGVFQSRAQQKSLVFIAPTLKELAETNLGRLLNDIVAALSDRVGIEIKMQRPVYDHGEFDATETVLKAMKDNKAQMGYVTGLEYADLMGKYPNVFKPEFILMFDNKKSKDVCLYVKKDSPIKDVKSLRGTVYGAEDTFQTRLILHENGIDTPLSSFFKTTKFVVTSPVTIAIEALIKGDIDVFETDKSLMLMSGGVVGDSNKGKQVSAASAVRELECAVYDTNWIFGHRPDMPPDLAKKITQTMVNSHKDKAFQKFQFMFIAIKGHFVPFAEKDLARTLEIKKLKDKFGWEKERQEFVKKYKR